jgi:integrase
LGDISGSAGQQLWNGWQQQRTKMQRGNIFKSGGNWYLRFYRDEVENGKIVRRRVCQKLARYDDLHRTKKSVRQYAEKILSPLNSGKLQPESAQTVSEFIESTYLPFVREQKRPSTTKGYVGIFEAYLKARLRGIRLCDFRTIDGERILTLISHETGLSHRSLLHIKNFLSGAFTYAKRIGILDGINPMMNVSVPKGAPGKETYAYTLEEIHTMVRVLDEPARTAVLVAAFTGLSLSELRGLRWEDISGDELHVRRNVWRSHVGETKTPARAAPVPLLPFLNRALAEHKKRSLDNGFVFAGPSGRPRDLASMGTKVIRATLKRAGIVWHGWHSFRRGIATNLNRIGIDVRTIQAILRHSNVTTTLGFYVKNSSGDSVAALQRLERAMGNEWATIAVAGSRKC